MRCSAREDNGNQCRRVAKHDVSIFGDHQISHGWFWVLLCDKHTPENSDTRPARRRANPKGKEAE